MRPDVRARSATNPEGKKVNRIYFLDAQKKLEEERVHAPLPASRMGLYRALPCYVHYFAVASTLPTVFRFPDIISVCRKVEARAR